MNLTIFNSHYWFTGAAREANDLHDTQGHPLSTNSARAANSHVYGVTLMLTHEILPQIYIAAKTLVRKSYLAPSITFFV